MAAPDDGGRCSFGPTVDFIADLWPTIPLRIAHINPSLPRTTGSPGIPRSEVHALIDAPQKLMQVTDGIADQRTLSIADHVAHFIGHDTTLQTGLGKLPGAILRSLRDPRRLSLHSGLIGDSVLDLLESGALQDGSAVTTGVAIGTQRL